jgi:hypothetical protein
MAPQTPVSVPRRSRWGRRAPGLVGARHPVFAAEHSAHGIAMHLLRHAPDCLEGDGVAAQMRRRVLVHDKAARSIRLWPSTTENSQTTRSILEATSSVHYDCAHRVRPRKQGKVPCSVGGLYQSAVSIGYDKIPGFRNDHQMPDGVDRISVARGLCHGARCFRTRAISASPICAGGTSSTL